MEEEWRWIEGFEGRYEVSNSGRVRSYVLSHEPRPRKILTDPRGYQNVVLRRGAERQKLFWVHRLVAKAFVSNPHGYKEVNHIDGVKGNNVYTNLEWTTRGANNKHAYDMGLKRNYGERGEACRFSKLCTEDVLEIRRTYKRGNGTALAKRYGIALTHLMGIVARKSWSHI